ncbi:MAG TPA: hypothetical protein VJX29_06135 [Candidatus Acidoferrales bacterium]|nr:hypothetical protein [Candidatus Acidoferrales bacterium]
MSTLKGTRILSVAAAGFVFALTASAQSSTTSGTTTASAGTATASTSQPAPAQAAPGSRRNLQQQRIAQGVQSGQLTAGETQHLENREGAISKETHEMRSEDNGNLTAADKAKLNRQYNRTSRQIYDDKHNANTAHYGNNEVGQRRENQQDRIAQGVSSGSLTAKEAGKLEGQEKAINHQVAADRAADGGKLTPGEKQQINKEQNRESKKIYNKKHNAATRKP